MAAKKTAKVRASKEAAPVAPVDELSALLDAMGPVDLPRQLRSAHEFRGAIATGKRLLEHVESLVASLEHSTFDRATDAGKAHEVRLQKRADNLDALWLTAIGVNSKDNAAAFEFIAVMELAAHQTQTPEWALDLFAHRYPEEGEDLPLEVCAKAMQLLAGSKPGKWKGLLKIVEEHFASTCGTPGSLRSEYNDYPLRRIRGQAEKTEAP
jgi:hypothetical protein